MGQKGRTYRPDTHCACTCGKIDCASRRTSRTKSGWHRLDGPAEHGTLTAYEHWGCRCEPCRKAAEAVKRRKNEESRKFATNAGKEWTGPELEMVLRTDLTRAEIARRLGRTIKAVKAARHKLNTDPEWWKP